MLRVWIPKSKRAQRPLGIPRIRDRVIEMATLLVLGPNFEADVLRNQYGFRPEMDAKMAVRQSRHRAQSPNVCRNGSRLRVGLYITARRQRSAR